MKIIKKFFQFLKLTAKRLFSFFRKKPKRFTGEPCPIIVQGSEPEIDERCVHDGLILDTNMDYCLMAKMAYGRSLVGYNPFEILAIGKGLLGADYSIGDTVHVVDGKSRYLWGKMYVIAPIDIGFREIDS